jgi:hypothetical protein
MHWAYFSDSCCNCVGLGAEEAEPTASAVVLPAVVVLPAGLLDVGGGALATRGGVEPPQLAAGKARPASARTNRERQIAVPRCIPEHKQNTLNWL